MDTDAMLKAWIAAPEMLRIRAALILTGAHDPMSAEPYLTLKQVANRTGYHYTTLMRRGIRRACSHFAEGTCRPRYRLSEVAKFLDTPKPKKPTTTSPDLAAQRSALKGGPETPRKTPTLPARQIRPISNKERPHETRT